jgi:hypothetical protein
MNMLLLSSKLRRAYRMNHGILAALCLAIALVAGACVPGYTVTERLDGDPVSIGEFRDGADCAWIEDGSGKRTQLLLFEEGVVLFDPLRFVDPTGSIIARAGDVVTVTGPSGGIGETICAAPGVRVFSVDVITGPGGTLVFPTFPPLEP